MSETTFHRIWLESYPPEIPTTLEPYPEQDDSHRVLEHIEFPHSRPETLVGKALRRVVVPGEQAKTGDET